MFTLLKLTFNPWSTNALSIIGYFKKGKMKIKTMHINNRNENKRTHVIIDEFIIYIKKLMSWSCEFLFRET